MPLAHTESVRYLLASLVAAAVVGAPALAAEIDPSTLVLRSTDIPSGYVLVRRESGRQSNERAARGFPRFRELSRTWGRVTGYQRIFERGERSIEARVDVFRGASGARRMLAWSEREARLAGVRGLRQGRADVGAEAWVFWGGSELVTTYVYWRYGPVWSAVGGRGMPKQRALELARRQQRLIAAGLG